MEILKFDKYRNKKIVLIQGSARDLNNCPNENGKTKQLINEIVKDFPNIDFDIIDLSIRGKIIQPCKGCVSTAGGAHCHYSCDCYMKNSKDFPDMMYDDDIYEKLEKCDAFVLFTPIYWFSVPTMVKALFDRLVCINLSITNEQAKELLGENLKNSEYTKKLSLSEDFQKLKKNHWEGKYAAFFVHGDAGSDDYLTKNKPESLKKYQKEEEIWSDPKMAIMPIVNQLRYSGINVPDELLYSRIIGKEEPYAISKLSENDINMGKMLIKNLIKLL